MLVGEEKKSWSLVLQRTTMNGRDKVDNEYAVAGGVKDMYGEDSATMDQPVTPWTVSVAR